MIHRQSLSSQKQKASWYSVRPIQFIMFYVQYLYLCKNHSFVTIGLSSLTSILLFYLKLNFKIIFKTWRSLFIINIIVIKAIFSVLCLLEEILYHQLRPPRQPGGNWAGSDCFLVQTVLRYSNTPQVTANKGLSLRVVPLPTPTGPTTGWSWWRWSSSLADISETNNFSTSHLELYWMSTPLNIPFIPGLLKIWFVIYWSWDTN